MRKAYTKYWTDSRDWLWLSWLSWQWQNQIAGMGFTVRSLPSTIGHKWQVCWRMQSKLSMWCEVDSSTKPRSIAPHPQHVTWDLYKCVRGLYRTGEGGQLISAHNHSLVSTCTWKCQRLWTMAAWPTCTHGPVLLKKLLVPWKWIG